MEEMGKAANCASQKLNTLFKIIEAPIFALLVKGANLLFKADSTATWTNFDNFPLYRAISLTIEDDTKVNLSCAAKYTLQFLYFGIDLYWQFETHTQNLT